MDDTWSRFRAERAEDREWSTVCAGVDPQQFQSGTSVNFMSKAAQTARLDISYSIEVPVLEHPG